MLKSPLRSSLFLFSAMIMASLSACGPGKAPPEPKLKRDGSDISMTQIATQVKVNGGLTVDAYEVSIPAAKSTTILISVDGGKIDTKNPNDWLYDGRTIYFDPYSVKNCVVILKKGLPMGVWAKDIKPEDAKTRLMAGGTVDLPIQAALKSSGQ